MSSLLFTFDTDEQSDVFIELLQGFAKANKAKPAVNSLITNTLNTLKKNPKIREEKDKIVALFVAGNAAGGRL